MPKSSKYSIEQAWKLLFEKYDIPHRVKQDGLFNITASQINEFKEARLMAKFDQSAQLPEIFRDNKLSILPTKRGEYVIGSLNAHTKITYSNIRPTAVQIPDLQTLDHTDLYSEASALLFAYNSGIIKDILGSSKVNFTVNGRMSSGNFDYLIDDKLSNRKYKISAQNVQVEIDAGYESPDAFCICEAKNIAAEEILIRQLYFPYRLWRGKITKPIVPVFLVFSNDIFHVFKYAFENEQHYNSLKLLKHSAYTFEDEPLNLNEVIELWQSIRVKPEPKITFPQADSFARVVDLLSVLFNDELTRDEVTLKYEFEPRQTDYYIAACEYLGLVERTFNENHERQYKLSSEAIKIMKMRYKLKHLALIKKVLERPIFNQVFGLAISSGQIPDTKEICRIMSEANLSINSTTIERRASTVRGWIDWVLRQTIAE